MNSTPDMTARYSTVPDAIESRLGDETVILHLASGTYIGLDAVGTIIWERLQAGDTLGGICEYVRNSLSNVPDTVEADTREFLTQLLEHSLIEPR